MIWNFDPVLFSLGSFSIHWYGLIFALAILSGYSLVKYLYVLEGQSTSNLDNLLVCIVAGVVIGARLGHCFFYDPHYYLENPIKILMIWEGGLASHGGGLGAILGIYLHSKAKGMPFLWLLDRIVLPTAVFAFSVRIANFLNSEILGAGSNVPWAVVFTRIDDIPRHPVQLYEAMGYLAVFLILITLYAKYKLRDIPGTLFSLFLILVFSVRFLVEFMKEPQASYSMGLGISVGQLLSVPFFTLGVIILIVTTQRHRLRSDII